VRRLPPPHHFFVSLGLHVQPGAALAAWPVVVKPVAAGIGPVPAAVRSHEMFVSDLRHFLDLLDDVDPPVRALAEGDAGFAV